jgi:hypothetical protein
MSFSEVIFDEQELYTQHGQECFCGNVDYLVTRLRPNGGFHGRSYLSDLLITFTLFQIISAPVDNLFYVRLCELLQPLRLFWRQKRMY